jgi:hypothetical protein
MHPADYNASRPLAPCAATSAAPGSNVTSLGLRAFNFKQYDYRARSMVKTAAFWRRVAGVKFVTLITQVCLCDGLSSAHQGRGRG